MAKDEMKVKRAGINIIQPPRLSYELYYTTSEAFLRQLSVVFGSSVSLDETDRSAHPGYTEVVIKPVTL